LPLLNAIANPGLARSSLPWRLEVVTTAGTCTGCSTPVAADRVEGHATQAAQSRPPRMRCVHWAYRIPWDPA
jgi:hypothetical protein